METAYEKPDLKCIMIGSRYVRSIYTLVVQEVKINAWQSQKVVEELTKDFKAEHLIEDKGYDSETIVEFTAEC